MAESNLNEKSKMFSLNKNDLKKILKGLGIAMGGAGATYLLGILDMINVDAYSPLYVALASAILNALMKFIQGQSVKV